MSTDADTTIPTEAPQASLLVIDDDVIQRTIISKIGTQAGFKVTSASTYEDADSLLRSTAFDCITLDLSLGEKSGVFLLRSIVESKAMPSIIIISGADEEVLRTTAALGNSLALDTVPLSKPLNLAELRTTLAHKFQSASQQRDVTQLRGSLLQAS